jgi:hypothetical protein
MLKSDLSFQLSSLYPHQKEKELERYLNSITNTLRRNKELVYSRDNSLSNPQFPTLVDDLFERSTSTLELFSGISEDEIEVKQEIKHEMEKLHAELKSRLAECDENEISRAIELHEAFERALTGELNEKEEIKLIKS